MRSTSVRFGLAVLGLALMSLVQARADTINYSLGNYSATYLGSDFSITGSTYDHLNINGGSSTSLVVPVTTTVGTLTFGVGLNSQNGGQYTYSTAPGWTITVGSTTKTIDQSYFVTVSSSDTISFTDSVPLYFALLSGNMLKFTVLAAPSITLGNQGQTSTEDVRGQFEVITPEPASVGMAATAVVAFAGYGVRRRWRRA